MTMTTTEHQQLADQSAQLHMKVLQEFSNALDIAMELTERTKQSRFAHSQNAKVAMNLLFGLSRLSIYASTLHSCAHVPEAATKLWSDKLFS